MNRKRRRRRARLRVLLLVGPPLIGLGSYLVGTGLPPVARVEVSRVLPVSAETVWSVLTDLDDMPAWRADLRSLERLPEQDGAVRWLEVGRAGRIAWERVLVEPPSRLVVREVVVPAPVERTFRILPAEGGVALVLEESRPVPSPLDRLRIAIFGPDRTAADGFVADLAARLLGRRQQVVAGPAGG